MKRHTIAVAVGMLLVTWAANAQAQFGGFLKIDEVPAAIKQAADKVAPKTTWRSAIQFQEGYKLTGRDQADTPVMVTVTNGQRIIDVRVTIAADKVPPAVRSAVGRISDYTLSSVRAVGPTSTKVTFYEVSGKGADGKSRYYSVSPDGMRVMQLD